MKAIKSIKTLIKLKNREIDEIVTRIGELEKTKTGLVLGLEKLRKERDYEIQYQQKNHEFDYITILSNFLEQLKIREERLIAEIQRIDGLIDKEREELYKEFSELKKFEQALKNRVTKYEKELERKENARIDEYNTTKFLLENDN